MMIEIGRGSKSFKQKSVINILFSYKLNKKVRKGEP